MPKPSKTKKPRLRERIDHFLSRPGDDLSFVQRSLRKTLLFGLYCARELQRDRAGTMAAALTYHTLFSLLPTLVLMLVVSTAFIGPEDRERFKDQAVAAALQWLDVAEDQEPSAEEAPEPNTPGLEAPTPVEPAELIDNEASIEDAEVAPFGEFNRARNALSSNLEQLLDFLETVNLGGIGVIGLLVFIYGATGLLATIEGSFNQIYKAQQNRPWYLRMVFYYFVITMAPALVLAGQIMQQRFISVVEAGAWTRWLAAPLVVISPLFTTWLAISFAYVLLPNTRVSTRLAVLGGLVTSVGWLIASEAFGLYVQSAAITSLYGALALLPLSLMYIWVLWLIVLFGLEVAYTLQMMPAEGLPKLTHDEDRPLLLSGTALIAAAVCVARAFDKGDVVTTGTVSNRLGITMDEADALLDRLEERKLILYVEGRHNDTLGWSLSRPPDKIGVGELISVAHSHEAIAGKEPVLRDLQKQQVESAGDRSLRDLIDA
ncbi:MAG: YihY/virulence factor BrkB family protein [Phycisphaeraceae bacterium]